jgi:hypothetical protein
MHVDTVKILLDDAVPARIKASLHRQDIRRNTSMALFLILAPFATFAMLMMLNTVTISLSSATT